MKAARTTPSTVEHRALRSLTVRGPRPQLPRDASLQRPFNAVRLPGDRRRIYRRRRTERAAEGHPVEVLTVGYQSRVKSHVRSQHELRHLGPGEEAERDDVVPVPGETCIIPAAVSYTPPTNAARGWARVSFRPRNGTQIWPAWR